MIWVALVQAVALVAVVAAGGTILARLQRAHARREDLLVNQLLHAAGNAWQAPPAQAPAERPEPPERTWTTSPEQLPVN